MFPSSVIEVISKASPFIGGLLGGPVGASVGNLVSSALGGVNMTDPESLASALANPGNVDKLKELELQLNDLQNARLSASKETGALRYQRLVLALVAMVALVVDIYAIQYVTDKMLSQILITMLVFLAWDIRQIYKFYFGSSDDLPNMGFKRK